METVPVPPKKNGAPRWSPAFDDDVQGSRREHIINEHLKWWESEARQSTEKDFSDAPILKFLKTRKKKPRGVHLRRPAK